ncbi:MAG: aminopeptidase, partial [Methanobacteriota archaeon]
MTKLAANLVRSCLRITPDDNVTIFFYPHTQALTEEIAEECFK